MLADEQDPVSRRQFNKAVAAAGVGLAIPAPGVFAAGSDTVRVAMVGGGERGTVDAVYCLKSAPGVELVAMADLFQDRVDAALAKLEARSRTRSRSRRSACSSASTRTRRCWPWTTWISSCSSRRPASGRRWWRRPSRRASTSSWRSPARSTPSACGRSSSASKRARQKRLSHRRRHAAALRAAVPGARCSGSATGRSAS